MIPASAEQGFFLLEILFTLALLGISAAAFLQHSYHSAASLRRAIEIDNAFRAQLTTDVHCHTASHEVFDLAICGDASLEHWTIMP